MFGKWGGKHLIENLCERWSVNNISKIGGRNECLTSASVQMLRIDIGVKLFRGGLGSVWRLRYCHSHGVGRGEAGRQAFHWILCERRPVNHSLTLGSLLLLAIDSGFKMCADAGVDSVRGLRYACSRGVAT